MKSLGFMLVLVTAAALIKPSGGEGEEEDWKAFLLQWRQHPSFPSPLLNGDMADKIWSICLQHMIGAEEILGTVLPFASDELSSRSSENSLKAVLFLELLALIPQEKISIACDCISANYLSLGIPPEFSVALSTYLANQQSLIDLNYYQRRQLADQLVKDSPSMAPLLAPPMSSGDETQFPQSVTETPFIPSNSLNIEPPSQPHHRRHAQKHRGVPPPVSPLEKHKDYIKLVLIAILPTAAVSFIIAFLVFYCCGCNKSKVSVSEQRDDHPLLQLQLASPGSSPNPYNPTNPLHNDDQRGRHRSCKSGDSMNHCFPCWFKGSTDVTPPSQVTGEIPGNNASSDAPKPMPAPPPPPLPPKAPPPPPGPLRGSRPRLAQPPPVESSHSEGSSAGEQTSESSETELNAQRVKLRPFYWDKVLANPQGQGTPLCRSFTAAYISSQCKKIMQPGSCF